MKNIEEIPALPSTETTDAVQPEEAAAGPSAPADNPGDANETSDASDPLTDSLGLLLAEAEQRGYLRARNEIARAAMRSSRLWENTRRHSLDQKAATRPAAPADADEPDLTSNFLSRLRPGAWD